MSNRKLILISNDDGIGAPGLESLIAMSLEFGDVVVVAPDRGYSGASHSITLTTPLRALKVKDSPGLIVYAVAGTPVDCVKLAMAELLPRKPDLMLSGINHGSNAAINVLYSGTMGAAIEASLYDIPSVGFSLLDHSHLADFSLIKKHGKVIIEKLIEHGLPPLTSLNINYPVISESDFKGYKICKQTSGVWRESFDKRVDPYGYNYYWMLGDFNNFEPNNQDADEWALQNNYAAIVPIVIDFTNYAAMSSLKKWNL